MGLVMQEPSLFNYNITENILYGDLNAKNSEIREAAHIANALEFIEGQATGGFDDSAEALLRELKDEEHYIRRKIGEAEYNETV